MKLIGFCWVSKPIGRHSTDAECTPPSNSALDGQQLEVRLVFHNTTDSADLTAVVAAINKRIVAKSFEIEMNVNGIVIAEQPLEAARLELIKMQLPHTTTTTARVRQQTTAVPPNRDSAKAEESDGNSSNPSVDVAIYIVGGVASCIIVTLTMLLLIVYKKKTTNKVMPRGLDAREGSWAPADHVPPPDARAAWLSPTRPTNKTAEDSEAWAPPARSGSHIFANTLQVGSPGRLGVVPPHILPEHDSDTLASFGVVPKLNVANSVLRPLGSVEEHQHPKFPSGVVRSVVPTSQAHHDVYTGADEFRKPLQASAGSYQSQHAALVDRQESVTLSSFGVGRTSMGDPFMRHAPEHGVDPSANAGMRSSIYGSALPPLRSPARGSLGSVAPHHDLAARNMHGSAQPSAPMGPRSRISPVHPMPMGIAGMLRGAKRGSTSSLNHVTVHKALPPLRESLATIVPGMVASSHEHARARLHAYPPRVTPMQSAGHRFPSVTPMQNTQPQPRQNKVVEDALGPSSMRPPPIHMQPAAAVEDVDSILRRASGAGAQQYAAYPSPPVTPMQSVGHRSSSTTPMRTAGYRSPSVTPIQSAGHRRPSATAMQNTPTQPRKNVVVHDALGRSPWRPQPPSPREMQPAAAAENLDSILRRASGAGAQQYTAYQSPVTHIQSARHRSSSITPMRTAGYRSPSVMPMRSAGHRHPSATAMQNTPHVALLQPNHIVAYTQPSSTRHSSFASPGHAGSNGGVWGSPGARQVHIATTYRVMPASQVAYAIPIRGSMQSHGGVPGTPGMQIHGDVPATPGSVASYATARGSDYGTMPGSPASQTSYATARSSMYSQDVSVPPATVRIRSQRRSITDRQHVTQRRTSRPRRSLADNHALFDVNV